MTIPTNNPTENLRRILRLRPVSQDILSNRENSQLEFKTSFNLGSGPDYAKSMAAFANNEGGYIVFGVHPRPHKIAGILRDHFEAVDPVKITDILNSCFSPEILWDMDCIDFQGKTMGFIYTHEALEKPIVATKNSGNEIKEGCIYYRYRAKSTTIRYPELRNIIDNILERERKAWLQHLEIINKSGPTKVGIIDTVQGKVFGAGAPFLIDESLLRQLKFIREGSFRDTGGSPTLRLIGDLQTIGGISVERTIQTGIHYDDLITAFLAKRLINSEDAKSYLVECAHQTTPNTPIFYFISQAKINLDQAIELLDAEQNALNTTVRALTVSALKKRLDGTMRVIPFGKIEGTLNVTKISTSKQLIDQIMQQPTESGKRSLIYQTLKTSPRLVRDVLTDIPLERLFEAISNLSKSDIESHSDEILGVLLDVFNTRFQNLPSSKKTQFRKAMARVEEELYG